MGLAFESLSDKLQNIFKNLRGKGRLTEEDVKAALKEVKIALLEADVNFKVVKDFVKKVNERAVGQDVMNSLTPGQMVIKIVNEELTNLMGSETTELKLLPDNQITVIMMMGLQGAGKTTTTAKIARKLKATIANMNHYKKGIALSKDEMVRATANEIKVMHTKCMGPDDMISSLSGGNQQKAIFGRWLERSPNIFMMDDPTRGIDVGAKYEIYELIINMAKQGKTIIVVSSEMPEILGITNRIGVMSNGHLAGIVNTKETDQEELLRLSAKYL